MKRNCFILIITLILTGLLGAASISLVLGAKRIEKNNFILGVVPF